MKNALSLRSVFRPRSVLLRLRGLRRDWLRCAPLDTRIELQERGQGQYPNAFTLCLMSRSESPQSFSRSKKLKLRSVNGSRSFESLSSSLAIT